MSKQQGKTAIGFRLGIGLILTILIAVLIYAFLIKTKSIKESDFVFDGWLYNRDDQKRATTALAKAGLFDYHWESGRLSVPQLEKNKYESALTENAAFPKAPSDIQWESLKEMGQFESESKIRARELLSCAKQLEQTFEYYEKQIQYATVGVRLRREQTGLTVKNITTASIGICMQENATLTPELLSAITIAAKHQLGISNNKDISILDFRAGRAYLGTEEAVSNAENASLLQEQKRQEVYWQEKLQNALSFIPNIKISATVDLEPITPVKNESKKTLVLAQADENGQIDQQSIAYIGFPDSQNSREISSENDSSTKNHFADNNIQPTKNIPLESQEKSDSNNVSLNQSVISTESSDQAEIAVPELQNENSPEISITSSNSETVSIENNVSLNDSDEKLNDIQNNPTNSTQNNQTVNASLIHLSPIKQKFDAQPISNSIPNLMRRLRGLSVNISIPESYIEQLAINEFKRLKNENQSVSAKDASNETSNATFVIANGIPEQTERLTSEMNSETNSEISLNDLQQNGNNLFQNSETAEFIALQQITDPEISSKLYEQTKKKIILNVQELVLTLLNPVLKGEGIEYSNSNDWVRVCFYSDHLYDESQNVNPVNIVASKPVIVPLKEFAQQINRWGTQNLGIIIPITIILGLSLFVFVLIFFRKCQISKPEDKQNSPTTEYLTNKNNNFVKNSESKSDSFIEQNSALSNPSFSSSNDPDQFYRLDSSIKDHKANILNELYQENEEELFDDELELNSHLRNDSYDSMQKEVKDLIANHPEQAAQIIRHWIQTGT